MVLVLSGTKEGNEIAARLIQDGYQVTPLTCTYHPQGVDLKAENSGESKGPLANLADILSKHRFAAVVDISHPFASDLADTVKDFCATKGVPYIRYMREETRLPAHPSIYPVYSWEEAASTAAALGKTVFLTTGSNNLETFLSNRALQACRVVVRVLPDYRVIKKCQELGIAPRDIVAMQGPFSKEINKATFKAYKASVVVTKDSGKAGGTDTKIAAALALKIPVIVIKRLKTRELNEVYSYQELYDLLTISLAKQES